MSQQTPTEFNHYQQSAPEYTEQILWHRVFAAAAVVVAVISAAGWGLYASLSDGDAPTPLEIATLAPAGAVPAADAPATATQPPSEQTPPPAPLPQLTATADTVEMTDVEAADDNTDDKASTLATADREATAVTAATEQATRPGSSDPRYQVKVTVLNQDISNAVLTDQMNGLEPATSLESTARLGDSYLKLYFYTDLEHHAGDTLTYSWYRNDKRVAKVRIPVGSDRWRSHASKNITANMHGEWKVIVTDRNGKALARSEFYL